jgi:hypothetical protein
MCRIVKITDLVTRDENGETVRGRRGRRRGRRRRFGFPRPGATMSHLVKRINTIFIVI